MRATFRVSYSLIVEFEAEHTKYGLDLFPLSISFDEEEPLTSSQVADAVDSLILSSSYPHLKASKAAMEALAAEEKMMKEDAEDFRMQELEDGTR